MKLTKWTRIISSLYLLAIPIDLLAKQKYYPYRAILSQIRGDIKAGNKKDLSKGFNGKVLKDGHSVRTAKDSRVTIIFNDGSKIRLFSGSEIIV